MIKNEDALRSRVVQWGSSLFNRGLTAGSSGNISVKLEDGYLITPTNSCLGFLDPDQLCKLDHSGRHISGDAPSKELPLHMAFYEGRRPANAVVHLHSTHATALSCLSDIDQENAVAPITPYMVMRVGRVPVLPYAKPGSSEMAHSIRARALEHPAILLANHGPIVAGTSLENAIYAMEELEETAKLILLTKGMAVRNLDDEAIADLDRSFRLK